jgi:hypothetical protein
MTTLAQRFMSTFARHGLLTDKTGTPAAAVWTPAGGSPTPIDALLHQPYESTLGMVEDAQLRLECAAADVPGIKRGDAISIGSDAYQVVGIRPNGKGSVFLPLQIP